jgi:hypothetical protein
MEMILMSRLEENKIPVSISWIQHQDGKLEPEVSLGMDDFVHFDGCIVEELVKMKKDYQKLLKKAERLKIATKTKDSRKIWRLCKVLSEFNEQLESKFIIEDSVETFSKDIRMSIRYIRNCIDFVKYFSYYDVSKKVPFTYYNVVTDFAPRLENLKLLKKEKQFLKKCGETNSLPDREQYRIRLRKITRENLQMKTLSGKTNTKCEKMEARI